MLTNQHRYAARIINHQERQEYKKHMCGVCHGLGDDYGMVSRVMTNHEIILLNMLTEAQMQTATETVMRRCPLNPTHHVRTNQSVSSKFAAAIAVLLVNTGVEDDLRDGKGLQLPTRLLKAITSRMATGANDSLNALHFDTSGLLRLQDEQSHAEKTGGNPLVPSMRSSSAIFAMTADLAGQPQNQPALAAIGANYGAYLYLLDAVQDYAEDIDKKQYNPLSKYALQGKDVLSLSQEGVNWLKAEFECILQNIREYLAGLQLYRYQEMIHKLLTEPVERIFKRLATLSDGLHYARIGTRDAIKSLLLMSEGKPEGQSSDDFFKDESGHPLTEEEGKKSRRKKRGKKDENGDGDDDSGCGPDDMCDCCWIGSWGYTPGDSCCVDSNCDGTPDCLQCGGGDGCAIGSCDGCGGDSCSGCDGNCSN